MLNENDDFAAIARKIRMQKMDREEILKMKNEAVTNERKRHKRVRSILLIQSFFRGYLGRKNFQNKYEELNIKTIIDYLYQKRKERIEKNASNIISYYINEYINKKRNNDMIILHGYYNYCADVIASTFKSYLVRKRLKPVRDLISTKKKLICKFVVGFKIRLILRSSVMQNILVEIANIKSCLNNMQTEDQLREDFKLRLPKLFQSFYETFYAIKRDRSWVDTAKCEDEWLLKYMSLIYKDNPKYKRQNTKLISKTKSKMSFGTKGVISSPQVQPRNDYDDRPIRPMKGALGASLASEGGLDTPQGRISAPISNPYEDYDNKPIKAHNIDYGTAVEENGEVKFDGSAKKKVIKKRPASKKPKYDARKAIEEAKQREAAQSGTKNDDKSGFREFLREIKGNSSKKDKTDSNPTAVSAFGGGGLGGGLGGGASSGNQNENMENKNGVTSPQPSNNTRRSRQEPTKIAFRKKLHELERSPPPKLNIHNVKSKVECWGTDNTNKQKIITNLKKVKKVNHQEPKSAGKISLQALENEINKIPTEFNLDKFFQEKEEKMKKNFKYIPYLKRTSAIVKEYDQAKYDELVGQLEEKFNKMKN